VLGNSTRTFSQDLWNIFGTARMMGNGDAGRAVSTSKQHLICSANRSALSERVAQGNLSQFNGLDFLLPWFGTRRSVVQIHSPRPLFPQLCASIS
jgi:hypothetical protein